MQLVVLGMHRSGTSSVTRLLNLAGAYFGAEGIATDPNEENPKGFWERRDVRAVCDALLFGAGSDWWRVADLDLDALPAEVREEQLATFRRIVLDLDSHRPWVVKEPRLSLLLPLLRPLLEAPVIIHVARDPLEIAESLATRNGFPLPAGVALWEAYTVGALNASAGEPRVLVSYADLIRDPVATTRTLLEELRALGVQGLREPTEREITAFVSGDLHRHRSGGDRLDGVLNRQQIELAEELAAGRLPAAGRYLAVSEGALLALRAFEESEDRASRVAELEPRADVADQLEAEVPQLEERVRDLAGSLERAVQQAATERRRTDERHSREVADLRRAADRQAASSAAAALAATNALEGAERHLTAVRRSGAARIGARASMVNDLLHGRRTGGVDGALGNVAAHLKRAREALRSEQPPEQPFAAGAGAEEPPPVDELRRQRASGRATTGRSKVAVLAWDVGHNPFGRAHLLADLLREDFDVEIWGSQFDRYGTSVWSPHARTSIPVRRIPGGTFPEFLDTLEDAARRIDADLLYVSKPRLPSVALAGLALGSWDRPLIVDVDDFEPAFFDEREGLPLDELVRHAHGADVELPFGRYWTRACDSVIQDADLVTVSNRELGARYGGMEVAHARDERLFDPSAVDRAAARRRMGLSDDDRLVLFGGTPRAHKGVVELLEALEQLQDPRLHVGVFDTPELTRLRADVGPLARWMLPVPTRAFDDLPGLLAAADLACALQAPDHVVAQYQLPAKVTDAMAMGTPCLVTPVPPLAPLIDKDVVEVLGADEALADRIRSIFDQPEETADRARRARELFLDSYSYRSVRAHLVPAVNDLLGATPKTKPALSQLLTTVTKVVRPGSTPTRVRRPVPAGATYDLAMFWKQNDSGIYGRRQDMFLKYLERSGRIHNIVHFDHPISAEAILTTARRSVGERDQNRLVLAQTVRRVARRADRGNLRNRTFVYSAGRRTRTLRLPKREDHTTFVRDSLEKAGFGDRPLLCWVYPTSPFLPGVIDAIDPDVVVADVVDDNRTWYEPSDPQYLALDRNYAEVLARSDVVLANCEPVAARMAAFAEHVELVANACELLDPMSTSPHRALASIRRPIVGYAGNLSDRVDLPLLRHVAQAHRDWSLVLVGSTHLDRAALSLADEPNVHLLGTQRYADAQAIMSQFDVGLIPHVDNEMTRSMNPLKAFVYASLGVPTVASPVANLEEMADYMTIADGDDAFVAAIEAALAAGRTPPDRERLARHSWEARVAQVFARIDDVASARATSAG